MRCTLSIAILIYINLTRLKIKPTKRSVHPAKTQISLGICPVWSSVFAVRSMGSWGSKVSSCGQWRLWSDWADAQADQSLRWAHMPLCWFCHEAAHLTFVVRPADSNPDLTLSSKGSLDSALLNLGWHFCFIKFTLWVSHFFPIQAF